MNDVNPDRKWPQFRWEGNLEDFQLAQIQKELPIWLQTMSEIVGP